MKIPGISHIEKSRRDRGCGSGTRKPAASLILGYRGPWPAPFETDTTCRGIYAVGAFGVTMEY